MVEKMSEGSSSRPGDNFPPLPTPSVKPKGGLIVHQNEALHIPGTTYCPPCHADHWHTIANLLIHNG